MKISEAFRNICRSHNLPYDSYNEVAKSVESYENNLEWKDLITEAKKYVGTIVSASVHPCAHLLLNGDIREELGVVRIGENICTMITSNEADTWKYLKNDYLIVTVWDIIDKVFKMINRPIMTIKEVLNNIDENVWKLFDNGLTCTLNQVDGQWATELLTKFKPRTLEELTMFVASIRPSFESLRDDFIDRKPYSTGSKYLDELFKNTYNRCVFQENIMKYFEWLGVTPAESIGLIKKISKKKIHKEDFDKLEERLKEHWKENTGSYDGFDESWADMQSNMSYSFNSPHGLATALDCLYCAYLKANYPVEYYTVVFNLYSDDGAKSERLTNECKYFNIKIESPIFRHSTSEYSCDPDNKIIYKGIGSIKNIGTNCGNNLYTLKDKIYSNFIELLFDIFTNKLAQKNELEKLIKIDYFREFGDVNYLLNSFYVFVSLYKRKTLKTSELDVFGITVEDIKPYIEKATEKTISGIDIPNVIQVICNKLPYEPITNIERISNEMGILGYTDRIDNTIPDNIYVVGNIDTNKYGTKFITIYHPHTGEYYQNKVKRSAYNFSPCDSGDIIKAVFNTQHKRKKNENDEWVQSEEQEDILKNYTIVKKFL
jgi:DNA polymerase III alpha subunit